MALPTRDLGGSGMAITRVGIGAWAMGGGDWVMSWGAQDDSDSVAAIHHALEQGVNWIDTAAIYGLGHSEEVVGQALVGLHEQDRPYVFTKCGLIFDLDQRDKAAVRIGAPTSIRTEVEQSLKRLGVERIDLYQMHWPPDDGTEIEEYWQCLVDLIAQGKIAAAGLSNHGVEAIARAEAIGHVTSDQPPFSLIRRESADGLLNWCEKNGTGVIVYSPMAAGLLSGSWSVERTNTLPPDDWRGRNLRFQGDALNANLQLVEALRPIAARHESTVASIAIAWTLSFSAVTGAIVGARNPSQVDGWIDAATIVLDERDLSEIESALVRTGAGEGPIARSSSR